MGKQGRIHRKNKGKRWKKGHSSSSNPETKKFRQAAKNRFFNDSSGPSNLTVEALAQHNESLTDKDGDVTFSESDNQSLSARTFSTWASNWTECTNTTFSRVHRYWSSNSAVHKEVLAVLAAVTEVIKSQGGKETETEYFGALITALGTVDTDESMAAVTYLLSLVIKRVPVAVLKNRFSEVAKTLLDVLATHTNSQVPSLLRSVMVCVASLLRVQDQAAWSDSSTIQVYHGLLAFTTHAKPKVRKAAQHAVRVILHGSNFMTQPQPPPHHPAASTTAKYCIQQIEQCGGAGEAMGTLHTLGLLKDVLGSFPNHSLKSVCETILRVMTLSNVLVTSVAMQALHGMFTSAPSSKCLPPDLNAQIITALYDFQPGENDAQPLRAWLAVMEKAHTNLARLDEKLCMSHMPRLFASCMTCMQSDKTDVVQAAANTIKVCLRDCVAPVADQAAMMLKTAPPKMATPIHKIFRSVEAGLSYQYHASWGLVLQILAIFFEVLGKGCSQIMKKCLLSMADLRDSYQFPYKAELDYAMGAAVKSLGPQIVLEAVPLQITGAEDDYEFPRSWLLPVLRDNVRETQLAFFTTYFLPLAAKLRTRAAAFAEEGRTVECKTYSVLVQQIWSLLPGFSTKPTDLKESFKGIARILGSAITDQPDLRMEAMASLRRLVTYSLDDGDCKAEVGRFAKNFLPLLFNLFTSDPEKEKDTSRLAMLETVKIYLQVADVQLICTFFDKSYGKLSEQDITAFRRHALMDLSITLIPYVDEERVKKLYQLVTQYLQSTDKTTQKKSYRALEEICSSQSEHCKSFVTSSLQELQQVLLQSLSTSSSSSKAPRLRCLISLFRQLDTGHVEFLKAVLPEAILCTKAMAERGRTAAYTLLLEMGEAHIRWSETSAAEAVQDYLQMVAAGLAGSPHMVSTTVLALSRIIYHYKDLVSSALLQVLIDANCMLLKSKAREIIQSALGLVKVLMTAFPDTTMAQFIQTLVDSLVGMNEDSKRHFRFKTKEIFERLVRKFGYQTIQKMVPVSHQKMLTNIRKTQERAKKKKKAAEDAKGSDDEDEMTFSAKRKPESIEDLLRDIDPELEDEEVDKKAKKTLKKGSKADRKGAAWLKEGGEEDIVDFLDPSVSKKVLATKPEAKKAARKGGKEEFKMAPDGRMIITEGSDEEETAKKGKQKEAPIIDDLDELLDAMERPGKKGRKRGLSVTEEDEEEEQPKPKYQAGGRGIHRPIKPGNKAAKQQSGEEYKAKKAGGDIKKAGKPDPFAYVPLQFTNLNKRKKAKVEGQFKNLVRGAQKGASKGSKMRGKRK